MTEGSVSVRGLSDDKRAWRSSRRDTRGKRGYDGSGLRGYDGVRADMTDLACAGMTEKRGAGMSGRSVSVRGLSDGKRAWRSSRRDTRGERGYDGSGLRGYDGVRAGMTEKRGAGMSGGSVSVRGLSDDKRAWRSPQRDTRGERGYDGSGLRGYDGVRAGMTDLACAGMTEKRGAGMSGRSVSVRGLSDDKRAWRSPRRDTRGERGYDGSGLRGYDGVRAGMTDLFCAGMTGLFCAGMTGLFCAGMTEV